jgi:threonine dehydrogenase-like Zn-dependent dehydrogenase
MGIVEEVGPEVTHVRPGDRVVIPFNVSCGHCWMCDRGLQSQCETTQVDEQGMGSTMLGFAQLYGNVPGGQAEFLRVPQAQYGPVKVPEEGEGMPDERFVYLSDVLPTSWQAVDYAAIPDGGTVAVLGLGPIGDMCCRIALHQGASRVIGIDLVPERLERASARGVDVLNLSFGTDGNRAAPTAVVAAGRNSKPVIVRSTGLGPAPVSWVRTTSLRFIRPTEGGRGTRTSASRPPVSSRRATTSLGMSPEADSFPAFSAMRAGSIAPERR